MLYNDAEEKIVKINDCSFGYDKKEVLHGINLSLGKNRFHCILGPNGSGKTTLLKCIQGNIKLHSGSIFIDSHDINEISYSKKARLVSQVSQELSIDYDFKCLDVVLMGRTPYIGFLKTERQEDVDIALQCMEYTGISYLKDQSINKISGGEKQRVAIARALAQKTPLVVLDEPTSHLDIHYQHQIMKLIRNLVNKNIITAVVVSHDINLGLAYCDNFVLMNKGGIHAEGNSDEVITIENLKSVYNLECAISRLNDGRIYVVPHVK